MAELCGRGLPRRIEPSFCRFLILQFLGLGLGGVKCCVVCLCRLTSTSGKGLRPKRKGQGSLLLHCSPAPRTIRSCCECTSADPPRRCTA